MLFKLLRIVPLLLLLTRPGTTSDQYEPPLAPDPQIPNANDPEDPYCNPFGPMTVPPSDLPDFPPEILIPDNPPDALIDLPDPPANDDPWILNPSLYSSPVFGDFEPIPPPPKTNLAPLGAAQSAAAATNHFDGHMLYPAQLPLFPQGLKDNPIRDSAKFCDKPGPHTQMLAAEGSRGTLWIGGFCRDAPRAVHLPVGTSATSVAVTPD